VASVAGVAADPSIPLICRCLRSFRCADLPLSSRVSLGGSHCRCPCGSMRPARRREMRVGGPMRHPVFMDWLSGRMDRRRE
jgi:hypothetical protein